MRGKDRGVRSGRGSNGSEGWEDVSIGVKGEREGWGDERLNLRGRKSRCLSLSFLKTILLS